MAWLRLHCLRFLLRERGGAERLPCQHYRVTAESLGVDPLRVQYRQMRRDLIRSVVQQSLHGQVLQDFVEAQAREWVPPEHQAKFLGDMRDDLAGLAPHTIVGVGISRRELEVWLALGGFPRL